MPPDAKATLSFSELGVGSDGTTFREVEVFSVLYGAEVKGGSTSVITSHIPAETRTGRFFPLDPTILSSR